MLLIYTRHTSSRLEYIADLIFRQLCCVQPEITTDLHHYKTYTGAKINYSQEPIDEKELQIIPHPLLFETTIQKQEIQCTDQNGVKVFFQSGGDIGFDILAASFYLVSRYEEYLPFEADSYGRYPHTASLGHQEGFLHLPLINLWTEELKKTLRLIFPSLKMPANDFRFIPTYDIDIAFSFRNKGIKRNAGGFLKNMIKGEWPLLKKRIEVVQGSDKDPYDCYDWLDELHEELNLLPVYFFLVAKKQEGYDKNISPDNEEYKQLIKKHAEKYFIGIHPSWKSNEQEQIVKEEIALLGQLSGNRNIVISRQHYIKMTLPETYRRLINQGIELDFTMGYGTVNGFRASIASPFKWFDLAANEVTNLTLYPFCFMEANSYYELKQNPEQAYKELQQLYTAVKKVNGTFVTIWHNHFLGTDPLFTGWKEMYELFLREDLYWDFLQPA
jgi:hypothetical protein